jgi:ribose 5-phosphate isomerase A
MEQHERALGPAGCLSYALLDPARLCWPPMEDQGLAREAAARAVVERLEAGMTIGLGSGRAVWRAIELIGERWPDGPPLKSAFASEVTRELAAKVGIPSVELDGSVRLELAIDGADEIDPQLGLIKGGGAALLREKIVVTAADRFLVVAETRKRVARLGDTFKLPVEVVQFGWGDTRRRLLDLVPSADLRPEGDAPKVTDEGHYLLDCTLPADGDLAALGSALKATVGVVEHGLFLGLASEALLGTPEGRVEILTAP